mgnify:CR=1 FL=1
MAEDKKYLDLNGLGASKTVRKATKDGTNASVNITVLRNGEYINLPDVNFPVIQENGKNESKQAG